MNESRAGTTVGTVDYMAPEQARDSRAASLRSDIYSLGCTFYYLLTGIPPYPGGDLTDKLTRHAKSPPPDVRDLRPDVPASLAEVLLRMMAKRPEDRFAGYRVLVAALDRVVVDEDSTRSERRAGPDRGERLRRRDAREGPVRPASHGSRGGSSAADVDPRDFPGQPAPRPRRTVRARNLRPFVGQSDGHAGPAASG